jgi:hypothetical protein
MADILNKLLPATEQQSIVVSAAEWNRVAQCFTRDHGVDYLPTDLTTAVIFANHLPAALRHSPEFTQEVLANTMQLHYEQSLRNRQIDSQHLLSIDTTLAGTDRHKESSQLNVRYNLGPVAIMVRQLPSGDTAVILTANTVKEPSTLTDQDRSLVSSITTKVFKKFLELEHSDPFNRPEDAQQAEILVGGIRQIMMPMVKKFKLDANQIADLIDHPEERVKKDGFAIMVMTSISIEAEKATA